MADLLGLDSILSEVLSPTLSPFETLYCPALGAVLGNTKLALLTSQLHYRLNLTGGVDRKGHHWIWETYQGWRQTFPSCSYEAIRYAVDTGRALGVLVTKRTQSGPMLYRIDYQ